MTEPTILQREGDNYLAFDFEADGICLRLMIQSNRAGQWVATLHNDTTPTDRTLIFPHGKIEFWQHPLESTEKEAARVEALGLLWDRLVSYYEIAIAVRKLLGKTSPSKAGSTADTSSAP